jgi:hypothetical protein
MKGKHRALESVVAVALLTRRFWRACRIITRPNDAESVCSEVAERLTAILEL